MRRLNESFGCCIRLFHMRIVYMAFQKCHFSGRPLVVKFVGNYARVMAHKRKGPYFSGRTSVSKTESEGSIPSGPAIAKKIAYAIFLLLLARPRRNRTTKI